MPPGVLASASRSSLPAPSLPGCILLLCLRPTSVSTLHLKHCSRSFGAFAKPRVQPVCTLTAALTFLFLKNQNETNRWMLNQNLPLQWFIPRLRFLVRTRHCPATSPECSVLYRHVSRTELTGLFLKSSDGICSLSLLTEITVKSSRVWTSLPRSVSQIPFLYRSKTHVPSAPP